MTGSSRSPAALCIAIVAALTAACASTPEPASAPIVCDPAAVDRIVLGYQWVNDWNDHYVHQLHGRRMLVVDGSCRYHVFDAALDARAMRSGVLDEATLAALNAELATGPFAWIDGEHVRDGSIDAAWMAVWRDGVGGSCEGVRGCAAVETPEPLARLVDRAAQWVARLHALGAPATGTVRVFFSSGELVGAVRHAWMGETDLVALFDGYSYPEGVRFEGADAALLRELRAGLGELEMLVLEADGQVWTVEVVDETPFDNVRGFLRPPFDVPYAPDR